jgi:hypothetical protein
VKPWLTPVRQPSLLAAMTEVSTVAVEDAIVGLWQALSRRDWDAVKTFLAEDCLYVDMPVPAISARGPDNIGKTAQDGSRAAGGLREPQGTLAPNEGRDDDPVGQLRVVC